jgi:hypothetical protein
VVLYPQHALSIARTKGPKAGWGWLTFSPNLSPPRFREEPGETSKGAVPRRFAGTTISRVRYPIVIILPNGMLSFWLNLRRLGSDLSSKRARVLLKILEPNRTEGVLIDTRADEVVAEATHAPQAGTLVSSRTYFIESSVDGTARALGAIESKRQLSTWCMHTRGD